MLKSKGFSILEIMIAVVILAALGLGIYRMQLSALAAAQQSLARQQALRAADSLLNQLVGNTLYQNNIDIGRSLVASEVAYSDNTTLGTNCSVSACTAAQMLAYLLFRWKSQLAGSMGLPAGNVKAILCRDNALGIPTLSNSNCSGNGNLVIKIVWQSHLQDVESALLGNASYIMLRVPSR